MHERMIRLLFTLLLVAFLSPQTYAQTCNKDVAMGKPVTASSIQAGNLPIRAFDGDPTSRWESTWSDPQWIMVDLEHNYDICTINLRWQVLATGYTLEISSDGISWTNLVTETANTGLNKSYNVPANGRYVRMTGITRGSGYGYSLYDFEVIGTEPISYCSNTNVAQLRPVTVSSIANGHSGPNAVDNNTGTRWESAHSDPQFISIDLGANYDLCRVVLNWEAAYGRDYTIDISTNGSSWTTLKTVTGNYMRDNTIPLRGNARYVRMSGTARGTNYGYSLWEFSVYALLPAISVTTISDAAEPSTGGSFRFSLPAGITFDEDITVNYTTAGTAQSGPDYLPLPGSVIIPAGQNSVAVPLTVTDDQIIEGPETVIAAVTNATSATHAGFPVSATNPTATINIADDDNIAANKIISVFGSANAAEPSSNGRYEFSLPAGFTATEDITVTFTTGGTAATGIDYTDIGTTCIIPAGQNSGSLTLLVIDDKIIEGTENVTIAITGASAPTLGSFTASTTNATASINIEDDDNIAANKVIQCARIIDAAEPSTNGAFSVFLPNGITVSEDVYVNYTVAGTATPGADYVTLSGTMIIPAGQNQGVDSVFVIDDVEIETEETVSIVLSDAGSATFTGFSIGPGANAVITIADDDEHNPANRILSITNIDDAIEGTSNGRFRISLPPGVSFGQPINVSYTIAGTAVSGIHYAAIPTIATIVAGQNSVDVQVTAQPFDNNILEGDKTVVLTLTGGTSALSGTFTANPASNTATVIIADDENTPASRQLYVEATGIIASEPATSGAFMIKLPGTMVASEDITVTYRITPLTGGPDDPALAGTDYIALSGTATIVAGQNQVLVNYTPIDDQIIENREAFTIELLGGSSPTWTSFGIGKRYETGYIEDDDNTATNKTLSIHKVSDANEPSTNGVFNISLPPGITASEDIIIYYSVSGTAAAGIDYTALGSAVTLSAGQNSVPLHIHVIDDRIIEATETVIVTLTHGEGIRLTGFTASNTNGSAIVNINDDDNIAANKMISIANANDGAEPGINGAFLISLPAGITVSEPVTVNFNVTGTATANEDYTSLNTSATILPGQNNITLPVMLLDDNIIEHAETVIVSIREGVSTNLGTFNASTVNEATVTINDDDNTAANKVISITAANNGAEPSTNGRFTISLPAGITASENVTVIYNIAGSATNGEDYNTLDGIAIIPAGQNNMHLTVAVVDDHIIEHTETVILGLTTGFGQTLGNFTASTANGAATVLITDEDNVPANKVLSITAANDAAEPSTNGRFTISLPPGITAAEDIVITYTVGGTATAGIDYTALSGNVIIPAGQNSASLPVLIMDDLLLEGDETVIVTITEATTTNLGTFTTDITSATITIADDENTSANKTISITTTAHAAEPAIHGSFAISLPTGIITPEDISISYLVSGTATNGTDYAMLSGTVVLPAGQSTVSLPVTVIDDILTEGNETVIVTLTQATTATLGDFTISSDNATATVNISDDDNGIATFDTWKTATLPDTNTDGKIGQGEEITYTIYIRNTGTITIPQLTIQDPVPAYTTYITGGALIDNNVLYNVIDLQPNAVSQVSFTVRTDSHLSGVQMISNVAQVSDGTTSKHTLACDPAETDCNMGNETLVPVREPQGDLLIGKRALTPPTNGQHYILGDNITYEVFVRNEGEKTFTNVVITDSLPAALDMPSTYASTRGAVVPDVAARKVINTIHHLLPGEEVTMTLTCRINDKHIVNTAYVTAAESETDLHNNIAVTTAAASIRDLVFINAFRPGTNGTNNRFVIVGLEKYPGSKLLVYNRWGSLVYQSSDYKNDWKALDLPIGGYIYIAEVKKPEGTVVYKGDFVLIR
ncbi:Calx-beta domain-containing protein [Chitinophaga rhizophila]|uniref:Discoidin domain-containing protein n=1 Tax=Chitinophaga rhizophila TaxID=2866212 RepID=A0ABS7G595_9BACT|nr:Calx-beta domain-containing protein [Chitinophaga rhizophila]MBW8682807.1 discoidin domain-containing protein [Chitinophaga rhizophila]